MKIWLFLITTCGLGVWALYSQRPEGSGLSEQAFKLTLTDTGRPNSLGTALSAISQAPLEQGTRSVAAFKDDFQELNSLPSDRQLGFARSFLDHLEPEKYTLRMNLLVRLDELDRGRSIPGLDELALSELEPKVLNSIVAPLTWKRSYGARLMGIYVRLHPGPDGKTRLQAKISDHADPALLRALTEAKTVLDDLTPNDSPAPTQNTSYEGGPETGAAAQPQLADIPITDFTPPASTSPGGNGDPNLAPNIMMPEPARDPNSPNNAM